MTKQLARNHPFEWVDVSGYGVGIYLEYAKNDNAGQLMATINVTL